MSAEAEYEVEIANRAKLDLHLIDLYLSQFYPSTPKKFHDALEETIALLRFQPHAFACYPYCPVFRKANVKKYLVFYTIDEEAKTVTIHHVRHGSRRPLEEE